jgi:serine/threonine protein kinase
VTHLKSEEPVLDREVAIKVLTGEPTGEYLKRFEREAKMQAKLNKNRHVVAIYSGGTFGGRHYLVMERMSRSLAQMPGPHSPAQVVRWLIQAADGLGALHAQGGVHCDVKLSNLLLAADGTLKVADHGT